MIIKLRQYKKSRWKEEKMKKSQIERKGLHIGFTGIDGAGKSTQASLLCRWFKENGMNVIFYEERRNFISEITDSMALEYKVSSGRKYLGENLYMVSISFEVLRQNLLNIRPYVNVGINIISSRTIFDWLAGGIARQCDLKHFEIAKEIILFGGIPDLTVWLDTLPEIAHERVIRRGFDKANLNYLQQYKEAFVDLFQKYPHVRVDGNLEIESIQQEIQHVVKDFLKKVQ